MSIEQLTDFNIVLNFLRKPTTLNPKKFREPFRKPFRFLQTIRPIQRCGNWGIMSHAEYLWAFSRTFFTQRMICCGICKQIIWFLDFSPLSVARFLRKGLDKFQFNSLTSRINSVPVFKGHVLFFRSFTLHSVAHRYTDSFGIRMKKRNTGERRPELKWNGCDLIRSHFLRRKTNLNCLSRLDAPVTQKKWWFNEFPSIQFKDKWIFVIRAFSSPQSRWKISLLIRIPNHNDDIPKLIRDDVIWSAVRQTTTWHSFPVAAYSLFLRSFFLFWF